MSYNKFDLAYMEMALVLSQLSYSVRKKVGCLIVSYNGDIPQIVSDGVNGTLPGHSNECEDENGVSYDHVLHAEENALRKLGDKFKLEGCVAYVTFQPCKKCAEKLVEAGISKVVYTMDYKTNVGVGYLKSMGVEVVHIPSSNFKIDPKLDYSGWLRLNFKDSKHLEKKVNLYVKLAKEKGYYIL